MILFFFQVEDATLQYFEDVVKQDGMNIDMKVPQQPETLQEYLEGWRRKIWDQGFLTYLRGANYFKKSDNFAAYEGSQLAVRRVLFRFVQIHLSIVYLMLSSSNQLLIFNGSVYYY